jgi:signal transduction histidine kinase
MLDTIECKQEQLVQSEKLAAIGKVTAGIAHEINNPLNNINLTAEVLLDGVDEMESDERKELIRDILSQTERARDIVHHLLSFSRKKTAAKEKINLAKILSNILHFLKNEMRLSNIQLETSIKKDNAIVSGNRNQLEQVLINIILNAIQAMGRGGKLKIDLQTDLKNGRVVIAVQDNGPGMSRDILKHILEPFYTTKKDGTGLGLSVSYGIIKDHGGDIKIESREGKGTTVKVILPLALEDNR